MPQPIRILHVFGALNRGGAETMIMNIYRNIDREKVQFDFIMHCSEKCDYTAEIETLGGKIYALPRFKGKNCFAYVKAWNHFFQQHPAYKIIHGHVRSTAAIYLSIAKKYGLVTIAHSHSTSNGTGFPAVVKNSMQYPVRYIADYLFACSKGAGEWMYGKKAVQKSNFKVIRNAIDISKYVFDEIKRKTAREQLGIDGKFVIGHVGRFQYPKNHRFLLEVFKEIYTQNRQSVLLLVGDGEMRPQIEQKIAQLNLQDCVILTGVRSDVPELLHAMDVFLFPSLFEGFPVTVVEAQAAGLPCVLSDSITKDVCITPLVAYMSLHQPAKAWTNKTVQLQKDCNRQNTCENIKEAGYDIHKNAEWIESFYIKVYNSL